MSPGVVTEKESEESLYYPNNKDSFLFFEKSLDFLQEIISINSVLSDNLLKK